MEGLLAMFMILIPVSVVSYVPSRLCDGNACNVDWTPVPNMGAALVGYNPVLSNTLKASDPGMKAMIFAPTFTRPAPDNRVEVNPNILYFDDIHCQMSRATRVVTSYQDYAQQRTGSFNFFSTGTKTSSFKIPLFFLLINYEKKTSETKSSSTDSSFQKDVKFFKDQGGEVYLNQAKCLVYKIEIDEFAKPVFTNGFKRAVKVLADEAADPKRRAKKTELRRFIGHFGTHYLSKSWLGATLSVESRFDRQSTSQGERNQRSECIGSAYSKSVNKGVRLNTFNVKLAKGDSEISTQIGGQGFGTGNGNGESKLKCSSFDELKKGGAGSSFSGTTVTSVGSYPESDPDEWAKTAGNNPKVIDFELKPIADLFRYYFLDDIDGLKGKAPLLKKYFEDAVKEYCQTMLGEDCPDTKGCGYQDLCPFGKKCVDDKSNSLGFVCAYFVPLYRYRRNRKSGSDHFYTTNKQEMGTVTPGSTGTYGYISQGVACKLLIAGAYGSSVPLYRYFRGKNEDTSHFYTTNENDIGTITPGSTGKHGYRSEGIAGYCFSSQVEDTVPLHRYYNSGTTDHFYTTDWGELGNGKNGYEYEGVQCYVFP